MPIEVGAEAPALDGRGGPRALVFYKVTCDAAALAGPALARLGAYGEAVVGVGQDPQEALDTFAATYGWPFRQTPDLPPYVVSNAYGVRVSPTVVILDAERRVTDVVESWDRDGMNRVSATLGRLLGIDAEVLSEPSDGLPDFKPG
jgi:hypothetical protein